MTNDNSQVPNRKGCGRERQHSTRFIQAHCVPLIEEVKSRMVRDWRRGISIQYLAKDFQLSTRQAEAVIWEQVNGYPPVSLTAIPRRVA